MSNTATLDRVLSILRRRRSTLGFQASPDGASLVGRVPHVAPLAFLHVIPAALPAEGIDEIEEIVGAALPANVRRFFATANGLCAFSDTLSVYGLRKSYARADAMAAVALPYGIEIPNIYERPKRLQRSAFVIGSYSIDGSKVSADTSGTLWRHESGDAGRVLNTWSSFDEWLIGEVERLDVLFDEKGRCIGQELLLPATKQ